MCAYGRSCRPVLVRIHEEGTSAGQIATIELDDATLWIYDHATM